MDNTVQTISLVNLSFAFIPVLVVLIILYKWRLNPGAAIYALGRMSAQLLLVGYFLAYLFGASSMWLILLILIIMIGASSWIALRTVQPHRLTLLPDVLISISIGGGVTLVLVTQGVLELSPWYQPSYFIPIAGMVFAASMNSISLAAERLSSELERNTTLGNILDKDSYEKARNVAFQASLIPNINALFAVGLVTLPGMMTGQILSGVSPLIASRYQIMVMCMILAAAGITTALFLVLAKSKFTKNNIVDRNLSK